MVNWSRMLADLTDAQVSYAELSRRTQIARTTIMRYLWGSQPSHHHGELLIGEWVRTTRKTRDQLPQVTEHRPEP